MKKVGVLALQGDFEAHGKTLEAIGAEPVFVRTSDDLRDIDGLIIPGGESTTMLKLLHREEMFESVREFGKERGIFGTCAGLILMASEVVNPEQECLGLLDVKVERNGYGRQVDSRVEQVVPGPEFEKISEPGAIEAVFIRAPVIQSKGSRVNVLAECLGRPVLIKQGSHIGSTFHPELANECRIHMLFLNGL